MKGARSYAEAFKTGQYGRMYITSGHHARGKTFEIQILPKGAEAEHNGDSNQCLNKDTVTVYGTLGGQPGWTEYYGWIHKGPWVEEFEEMYRKRMFEIKAKQEGRAVVHESEEIAKKEREKELLSDY